MALYLLELAVDFYIFCDARYYTKRKNKQFLPLSEHPLSPVWTTVYIAAACLILLTVTILLPRRGEGSISHILWLLYIFVSIFAAKLFYIIGSAIGRIPQIFRRKRLDTGIYVALTLAVLALFTMTWGATVGRRHIHVNEVTVESPRLPAAFSGYRIVQISDLHVDTWGSDPGFINKLVAEVNALHPDLIVFTGDIVSRSTPEIYPFVGALSKLNAPDGVFSVLGNHDYGDYKDWPSGEAHKLNNLDLIDIEENRLGWRMLNNEHVLLSRDNDTIALIGVENWGEPPFKQYGTLTESYPSDNQGRIHDGRYKILLSHNPMHWHEEVRKTSDIDLTLSGHTHAMQMQFSLGGFRWSPSQYRYPEWSGLYRSPNPFGGESLLYVNIGAGEVAMPARLGTAFPEITLFTLQKK